MPDLKSLLRDVNKKFPEIGSESIGIKYKSLKSSVYAFKGQPIQGILTDEGGASRDYIIGINRNMKDADNLVKVGAIAHCLSSINYHKKETVETGGGKQIMQVLFGNNRFTYNEHSWEESSHDSRRRGFGRSIEALDMYLRRGR